MAHDGSAGPPVAYTKTSFSGSGNLSSTPIHPSRSLTARPAEETAAAICTFVGLPSFAAFFTFLFIGFSTDSRSLGSTFKFGFLVAVNNRFGIPFESFHHLFCNYRIEKNLSDKEKKYGKNYVNRLRAQIRNLQGTSTKTNSDEEKDEEKKE